MAEFYNQYYVKFKVRVKLLSEPTAIASFDPNK